MNKTYCDLNDHTDNLHLQKEVLILLVIFSTLVQNGTPYFCNLTSSI